MSFRYLKFTQDNVVHCDTVFSKGAVVAIPMDMAQPRPDKFQIPGEPIKTYCDDIDVLVNRGRAEWLQERPKTKKNILTLSPLGEDVVHIRKEVLLKNHTGATPASEVITDPFSHALEEGENADE